MSYINKLQKMGITESRIADVNKAMNELHRALCKLDNQQLKLFSANTGLIGHLDMYAKEEDLRNVAVEMYNNNLRASVRNIDFDEFPDFSDKLFYLTEQAAELKLPGAKMLCRSLIDIRKNFELNMRPFSRLAKQAENIAQVNGLVDSDSLFIRMTHKYVDSYRHLDDNIYIGRVETLRSVKREDKGDDGKNLLFVRVFPDEDATVHIDVETLRDAIYRHYSYNGCTHEHDCCGCISQRVQAIKLLRINGFNDSYIFAVQVSWYRNN